MLSFLLVEAKVIAPKPGFIIQCAYVYDESCKLQQWSLPTFAATVNFDKRKLHILKFQRKSVPKCGKLKSVR